MLPLLQNLLETDVRRQWNFATFLDESQRILGMRDFYVCDTECGEVFRLYMEPRQRYVSQEWRKLALFFFLVLLK